MTEKLLPESEKALDNYIGRLVKEMGGQYIKLGTQYHSGLPDRMVLLKEGKVRFLELKSKGKHPSPLQHHFIKVLHKLEFHAYVVRGGDALSFLMQILQ